ncbi:MAG: tRNA pseudouridine(55) synthase TruB [Rhizobacter sp.]|nr:tRNA pseudouridine(55) synthase TruB [Ferruginibacter sp.]
MGKKGSYFANHRKRSGTEDEPVERKKVVPITEAKRNLFEEGQLILLDKPLHWTSFDAVRKIRNAIKIKKVGHAGTLDPLASGLLIICTGKFTKKINEYMAAEKEYTGSFTLGAVTPTYDLESDAMSFKETPGITPDQIQHATQQFIGHIKQMPPLYSAIKKEGVALYTLARRGKTVELEARDIFIREFDITAIEMPLLKFRVVCSTGTYIRSLANDFGAVLGCGGYLSELRRTRIGEFWVEDAKTIETFIHSLQDENASPVVHEEPF